MDSRTSLTIGTGSWFAGTIYAVATDDRVITVLAIVGGIALGAIAIWQRLQDGRDNDLRRRLTDAYKDLRDKDEEIEALRRAKDAEIEALRRDKDAQLDALRDQVRRGRDEVHHYRNMANRLSLRLRVLGEDPGDISYVAYDQEVERDHGPVPGNGPGVRDAGLPRPQGGDAPAAGDRPAGRD